MESLDDLDALGDFDADELAAQAQASPQERAAVTQTSEALSALDELDALGPLDDAEINAAIQNSQSDADEGASATDVQAMDVETASAPAAEPAEPVSDAPAEPEEELSFAELRRRAEAEEMEEEATDVTDGSASTGADVQLAGSVDAAVDPEAQVSSPAAVEEEAGERPLTMAELRRKADEEEEAELAAQVAAAAQAAADAEVTTAETEAESEVALEVAVTQAEEEAEALTADAAAGAEPSGGAADAAAEETAARAVPGPAATEDADSDQLLEAAEACTPGEAMVGEESSPDAPTQDRPEEPLVASTPDAELTASCAEPAADEPTDEGTYQQAAVELPEVGEAFACAGMEAEAEPSQSPASSAAFATPAQEAAGDDQMPMEIEHDGELEPETADASLADAPDEETADVTRVEEDAAWVEPETPRAGEGTGSAKSPATNGDSGDPSAPSVPCAPPSPVPSSTGASDPATLLGKAASPTATPEETPSPRMKRAREVGQAGVDAAKGKAARTEACDAETKQEKPKTAVPTAAEAVSPDPRAQLFGEDRSKEQNGAAGAETLTDQRKGAGPPAQAALGGGTAAATPGSSTGAPSCSKAPASAAETLDDKIKKAVKGYVQRAKTHKRTFGELLDHLEEALGIEARGERKDKIYGMVISAMKQRRSAKTAA